MISNVHYIELYINGGLMELESQESLHLRINNTLFNPTQTTTKQAEYSYSFEIPSTPNNDKILDYANNLSKINKFHTRYSAQVYSDGNLIFDGSLTIQKYDAKDKMYSCNLVNIKIDTLEEIFGDNVLTDVNTWKVDFDGADTINSVNADGNSKYWFPLVCYGAFIKDTEKSAAGYSSKYQIDYSNNWYLDSFYPSLNMIEEMKKCFEYKGYTVGGDALTDPTLNAIYCSTNLADEQQPEWNVGNPKFGKLHLGVHWTGSTTLQATYDIWTGQYSSLAGTGNEYWFPQDLKFPYFQCGSYYWDLAQNPAVYHEPEWNFTEVFINPLFKDGNIEYTSGEDSTMFMPDGRYVEIPADGFYKISFTANTQILQTDNITAQQWVCNWNDHVTAMTMGAVEETITFPADQTISTPLEIQLVRNYDENLELIKGKNNLTVHDGHPDHETECNKGRYSNYSNWQTCFPHEMAGTSYFWSPPTKTDAISDYAYKRSDANIGYMYADNNTMCYDPVVSPIFICGMTTMGNKNGGGCAAFIKNGYSWSETYSERTDAMYRQQGYQKVWYDSDFTTIHYDASELNYNTLPNAPTSSHAQFNKSCSSSVYGIVKLNKGDKIELMAVRRGYYDSTGNPVTYSVKADVDITIEAASPNDLFHLRAANYGWNSPTEFDVQLNLMNFTNKEKKISDWLKNIQDAFNLRYDINGNNVDITINKGIKKNITHAVSIDDRVNSNEVESEYISYPKEMSVKYKIDTDEHGFYASVPQEHINSEDWKDWGDSGFTVIKLSDDSYEKSSQNKQTQFSYTWYDVFKYVSMWSSTPELDFSIPVISKEEYMIDGFDYEESMKHRGYTLAQRFWFRNTEPIGDTNKYYLEVLNDWEIISSTNIRTKYVNIYVPKNQLDGINLSYKDTETSLVTEYFNIYPMLASNYVNVEIFLNPIEYIQIKGGALVNFDSDLYYTSEISGYDPSGANPTKLKLIKRT